MTAMTAPHQLRPIPLRELERLGHRHRWQFSTPLADLDSLTPVTGSVDAHHCGTYLAVSGLAETTITLTCDHCLRTFQHRLTADGSERIWLQTADCSLPVTARLPLHDLVETLDPGDCFDPGQWIYEQLCLQLPMRKRCGPGCPGVPKGPHAHGAPVLLDPRWQALATMRQTSASQDD